MQAVAWLRTRIAPWIGTASPLFYLCAVVFVASLLLGGGTRGGFLSDAILQLLAIPLLLVSLWRMFEVPLTRQMRAGVVFLLSNRRASTHSAHSATAVAMDGSAQQATISRDVCHFRTACSMDAN